MRGGKRVRDREPIGMVSSFASKSSLLRAMDLVRFRLMEEQGGVRPRERTFGSVIARYEAEEMPKRFSTSSGYKSLLKAQISPRWADVPLGEVRPSEVRSWLLAKTCSGKYKGNILGLMRVLFECAMLWEWVPVDRNPMSIFKIPGSTKREKEPETITLDQYDKLLPHLEQPFRMMVTLAMGTGLRCSELTALRWGNIDFLSGKLHIKRGIVEGREDEVKTVHSKKPLPLHPLLADALLQWRRETEFNKGSDFIFASPWMAGEKPYRSGSSQTRKLVPAGQAIGLPFRLGWHTFRHTYRAMLRRTGAPIDVQRDLMRHADSHTTTQVYGGVDVEELRGANSTLVEALFNGRKQ
jgi:integrase